jgi:hypothetical protein
LQSHVQVDDLVWCVKIEWAVRLMWELRNDF